MMRSFTEINNKIYSFKYVISGLIKGMWSMELSMPDEINTKGYIYIIHTG